MGLLKPGRFIDFFLHQNVLSPEGSYVVYPVGVQLILSIYGPCEQIWHYKNPSALSSFLLQNVLFDEVGWGGMGIQKYLLIIFFKIN